ncbi:NAD-dependent succinate-semialdehyde dehydrogenase [Bifidobacterium aquikefiricola]|uniref:NAD-dependent succinate-semialdehyde dehydrogenase n=1 Tax=Bifidobacterium aquikefiricola TaxID=3059038 RepID=A0AB39U796_9BIFI
MTKKQQSYAVTNPATGEVERRYALASDEQIATTLDHADHAYRTWGKTSTKHERARLLSQVADIYASNTESLANIITHEMGKSHEEAVGEVGFTADIYRYYADHGVALLDDEPVARVSGGTATMRKSPIGVLLGIQPWNYPYYQVTRFAAPNLMLGNTIILKHAELCPQSAAAMEQIFSQAGFPEGAYTNVYASFEQVRTIIADPRVRGVSLTGSERAGKDIAQQAGSHLKKVVCELGGNDPFIVLSTDNMDAAVEAGAAARFENCGQICNGAKRFIIVDALYDEFLSKFKAFASKLKLAPLCSVQAAERLSGQVHAALDAGATLDMGSADNHGAFFPACVLTDIPQGAAARHEEFFGPVAQFYRVSSEEEAIALANDTPYGLGSYLFTTDAKQAARVAAQIDAGMVYINESGADSAEMPFGGVKNSGFGREMGTPGIREFVNLKLISTHQE